MRSIICTIIMLCVSIIHAQTWHIQDFSVKDRAHPIDTITGRDYLHIHIADFPKFTVQYHQFSLVNKQGEEAGELWGYGPANDLIFEGKWNSLEGLWLEGNGHREPLFKVVKPIVVEPTIIGHNAVSNDVKYQGSNGGSEGIGPGNDNGSGPGPGPTPGPPGPTPGPGPGPAPGPPGPGPYPTIPLPKETKKNPLNGNFILYISTGDEAGKGVIYQVDDNGRVLGKATLPYTAMGIAMHRDNAIIAAIPRDGGSLVRIDDTGKQETIESKDKAMPHPIRITLPANSDTIVVADDIAQNIMHTTVAGGIMKYYKHTDTMINPSVAVADGRILFQEDKQVAADYTTGKWAIAEGLHTILINEGDKLIKKLELPSGKTFYKGGLMSWTGVGTLCVACQSNGEAPWIVMYDIDKNKIRSLFPWGNGTVQSFVVGPRMRWDRH